MSNQNQKKRRDPHVFDDSKLYLYAAPINPGDKRPRLRIKLYENNPVIDVDYGQKTDKGYQITHDTPVDPIVLGNLLTMIEFAARSKSPVSFELDNWGHPFMWDREQGKNVRAKDKMNISRIEVGRRDSGEVYMKYMAVKKPELEFVFADDQDYHKLQQDGNPMSANTMGMIVALSWSRAINAIYYSYYALKWEEPEWRKRFRLEQAQKFGGGGQQQRPQGGQQQNQGNNNTSMNSVTSDMDDDLLF